jgi:hypothetical protein
MTEAEWLAHTDLVRVLRSLSGTPSDRKRRLFAGACCRRIWHLLATEPPRQLVEQAERAADGFSASADVADFAKQVLSSRSQGQSASKLAVIAAFWAGVGNCREASRCAASAMASDRTPFDRGQALWRRFAKDERRAQSDLLRDIFGPLPFRPITVDPAWLRWNWGTVPAIAEHVYDDRAFHDLPILADALTDAGCNNEEIVAHCRSEGPHVRGCWVVDLILGKQ